MKTLYIVLLILLGHQALAFPKKKQQNSIHKSVPVENLKIIPNPGVATGDSRTTSENPGITIEDTGVPMFTLNHLGKPMAHQDLTKQTRKQHHQSILNYVPVDKIKDQVKISGQRISGKMRQSQSCDEFQSSRGTISFPLGGGNYINNEDKCWIIRTTDRIEIIFTAFELERCCDYLEVRDGSSIHSKWLNRFYGGIVPSPVLTSGNTAHLRFKSDYSITRTGFKLSWRPRENCGGEYKSSNGIINFPLNGGNYKNYEECIWTIEISSYYYSSIEITFESFDTEQRYDYLYVRDGSSIHSKLLHSFNGGIVPSPVRTTGNTAYLRFKSDRSVIRTGFKLSWRPATNTCQCGIINAPRINGGVEVYPKRKYPWQVGLQEINPNPNETYWVSCGGSIINDRWILTAAHCIVEKSTCSRNDKHFEVTVGEHNQTDNDDGAKIYEVKNYHYHEKYDCTYHDFDFALLELTEQILFDISIRPICLPENDHEAYVGRIATVSGWGRAPPNNNYSEILLEVQVQILDNNACGHKDHIIPWEKLCAGGKLDGKGHGHGDSGGPLVIVEDNKYVQVGIVSYSRRGHFKRDFYSRVSAVLPWITNTASNGNKCG